MARFSDPLGVAPYADSPYYVGFGAAGQDIDLDPNGHSQGLTGPVVYCHVDDIHETVARLNASGAEIQRDINDVGGGKLMAILRDPDGDQIGLPQRTGS